MQRKSVAAIRRITRIDFSGAAQLLSIRGHDKDRKRLVGWQVDRSLIRNVGVGLQRPECILAAFDAYGNLWITLIISERLVALTPEGELLSPSVALLPAFTAPVTGLPLSHWSR